jgi:hypothetical protein
MAVRIISAMKAVRSLITRQASSAVPNIAGLGKYSPNRHCQSKLARTSW